VKEDRTAGRLRKDRTRDRRVRQDRKMKLEITAGKTRRLREDRP
jgi:hypothetical protein